jgi:hypothetical protein
MTDSSYKREKMAFKSILQIGKNDKNKMSFQPKRVGFKSRKVRIPLKYIKTP